jgi:hypothetical protein
LCRARVDGVRHQAACTRGGWGIDSRSATGRSADRDQSQDRTPSCRPRRAATQRRREQPSCPVAARSSSLAEIVQPEQRSAAEFPDPSTQRTVVPKPASVWSAKGLAIGVPISWSRGPAGRRPRRRCRIQVPTAAPGARQVFVRSSNAPRK